MLVMPSAANDGVSVSFYNTAGIATTLNALAVSALTVVARGSPYSAAEFGTGLLEQRCVGWAVEIHSQASKYNAHDMTRGYQTPDGLAVSGADAASNYQANFNSRVAACNEQEILKLVMAHDNLEELDDWFSSDGYRGASGTYAGGAPLANAVAFLPINDSTDAVYSMRFVAHWEVRGRTVSGIGTSKPVDFQEFSQAAGIADTFIQAGAAVLGNGSRLYSMGVRALNHPLGMAAVDYLSRLHAPPGQQRR
jgi:hypothetical protein